MPRYTRTSPPRLHTRPEAQIDASAFDVQVRITDPEFLRDLIADGSVDAIITSAMTAEIFGISEGHLRNLRMAGVGPAPLRSPASGHTTGYRLSDVRAYLASLETGEAA